MFKRIIYEDWASYIPIISFWFTFSVFLVISLRAVFMRKDRVRYLGNLPLEEDHTTTRKDNA
jgi:hypothetical protein